MLPADEGSDGVFDQRVFVRSLCARKVQAQEAGVNLVGELVVKGVCGQPQGGFATLIKAIGYPSLLAARRQAFFLVSVTRLFLSTTLPSTSASATVTSSSVALSVYLRKVMPRFSFQR